MDWVPVACTWGGSTAKELAKSAGVALDGKVEWNTAIDKMKKFIIKGVNLGFAMHRLKIANTDLERRDFGSQRPDFPMPSQRPTTRAQCASVDEAILCKDIPLGGNERRR